MLPVLAKKDTDRRTLIVRDKGENARGMRKGVRGMRQGAWGMGHGALGMGHGALRIYAQLVGLVYSFSPRKCIWQAIVIYLPFFHLEERPGDCYRACSK